MIEVECWTPGEVVQSPYSPGQYEQRPSLELGLCCLYVLSRCLRCSPGSVCLYGLQTLVLWLSGSATPQLGAVGGENAGVQGQSPASAILGLSMPVGLALLRCGASQHDASGIVP